MTIISRDKITAMVIINHVSIIGILSVIIYFKGWVLVPSFTKGTPEAHSGQFSGL